MKEIASLRERHQGRRWHEDGSTAGPEWCDACALLFALDRARDDVERARTRPRQIIEALDEGVIDRDDVVDDLRALALG